MDFSDMDKMQGMLAQAQTMQAEMERKLSETVVEAQAGGGLVTVRMNGRKEVLRIKIQPTAMGATASDLEMLEDLITAAVNDAGRRADEAMQFGMDGVMGSLGLGGLGLPGLGE